MSDDYAAIVVSDPEQVTRQHGRGLLAALRAWLRPVARQEALPPVELHTPQPAPPAEPSLLDVVTELAAQAPPINVHKYGHTFTFTQNMAPPPNHLAGLPSQLARAANTQRDQFVLGVLAVGGAQDRHQHPHQPPGPDWRKYGRPIVTRVRETPTGHPTPARWVRATYRMSPLALLWVSGAPDEHDMLPYIERDFGATFVEIEPAGEASRNILLTVEWPMPW